MVGQALDGPGRRFETDLLSPLDADGNTQNLRVYVDHVIPHVPVRQWVLSLPNSPSPGTVSSLN